MERKEQNEAQAHIKHSYTVLFISMCHVIGVLGVVHVENSLLIMASPLF